MHLKLETRRNFIYLVRVLTASETPDQVLTANAVRYGTDVRHSMALPH